MTSQSSEYIEKKTVSYECRLFLLSTPIAAKLNLWTNYRYMFTSFGQEMYLIQYFQNAVCRKSSIYLKTKSIYPYNELFRHIPFSVGLNSFSNLKAKMVIITSSNNSQEAKVTEEKSAFLGEVSELCVL